MQPTSRSSGMAMPTTGTMVNPHSPSPSTGKDTRHESNHGNAPPPIQTESSPYLLSNVRSISLEDFNSIHLQESANNRSLLAEATMQHGQGSDKDQGSSDTNKAEASTTATLSKAPEIIKQQKIFQLDSPVIHPNEPKIKESDAHLCNFIINPLTNQICGQIFSTIADITTHIKIHTKSQMLTCKVCNMQCTSLSALRTHKRTHSDERPFQCNHCDKRYKAPHHLERHASIHTGKPSFVCSYCGKGFRRNDHLTLHIRTHTGDKPFVCDICNKAFAARSNLTLHSTRCHGKKPSTKKRSHTASP